MMLNLAQFKKSLTSGQLEMQILASQMDDDSWEVAETDLLPMQENMVLPEGILVLLERDSERRISGIKPVKDWILDILKVHLSCNNGSQLVAAEQLKIERWRQEMTVQNLELNRRFLEIETRREQLQELEQTLKQEQESLEVLAQKFQDE